MHESSVRPPIFMSVVSCGRSPDAWPIDIAWGYAEGEIRSMLLKPAAGWALDAWDKGCENQHRIGLEYLLKDGKESLDACLILNAALGQCDVYAGSPEMDSLWLFKLYKAAKVDPNFRLVPMSANFEGISRASDGVERLRSAAKVAQTA